jgi:hypothetical protein
LLVLTVGPALADETASGSKNFRVPGSVPNYFSNEAGPMQGPASETRRGSLYPNQAAEAPRAVAGATTPEPPRTRQRVAMAEPRGGAIRARRGAPRFARYPLAHGMAHGRLLYRAVAHGGGRTHVANVAARTPHPVSKTHTLNRTTRVVSSHRHARG